MVLELGLELELDFWRGSMMAWSWEHWISWEKEKVRLKGRGCHLEVYWVFGKELLMESCLVFEKVNLMALLRGLMTSLEMYLDKHLE